MDTKVRTKRCYMCKTYKPLEEFHYKNKVKGIRQCNCKNCMSSYSANRYVENREDYIERSKQRLAVVRVKNSELVEAHLRSHPCSTCGEADPRVLRTTLEAQEIANKAPETISSLLETCVVSCLNCREKQKID